MADIGATSMETVSQERSKSTHRVEIVPVTLSKHPDADNLSIIPIWGYEYIGRTTDWVGVTKAAYIPPDSLVDVTRPEFAFLAEQAKGDGKARIKARRLRGVVSYGLMVPVPDDTPLGEDWAERLGVEHYEPPLQHEKGGEKFFTGGDSTPGPDLPCPKYDVDAFLRYHRLFHAGEPVVVTEKLDGANARYVFVGGQQYCGSRTEWKKEFASYDHVNVKALVGKGMDPVRARETVERLRGKPVKRNLWWEALSRTPGLAEFCRMNPGVVVYGEVFGNVNCIKYGFADGLNRFVAFDLLADGRWVDYPVARDWAEVHDMPWAPRLHDAVTVPYDFEAIKAMAEGDSVFPGVKPGTIREGVVVRPVQERRDPHVGRVAFKCVSPTYLERYR